MTSTQKSTPEPHYFSMELVTPEIAETWLKKNSNNRDFKSNKIEQYLEDMLAGEWDYIPEAIWFCKHTGDLLQGQNHLKALIKSKKSFYFDICRNATRREQINADSGSPRFLRDHIKIVGKGSSNETTRFRNNFKMCLLY